MIPAQRSILALYYLLLIAIVILPRRAKTDKKPAVCLGCSSCPVQGGNTLFSCVPSVTPSRRHAVTLLRCLRGLTRVRYHDVERFPSRELWTATVTRHIFLLFNFFSLLFWGGREGRRRFVSPLLFPLLLAGWAVSCRCCQAMSGAWSFLFFFLFGLFGGGVSRVDGSNISRLYTYQTGCCFNARRCWRVAGEKGWVGKRRAAASGCFWDGGTARIKTSSPRKAGERKLA